MQLKRLVAVLIAGSAEMFADGAARRVIVSIPDRKAVLLEDGKVTRVYPVAVGKLSTPTPAGTFQIVTRIPHPTWYGPKVVVAPGKANPLGTRWIGLSVKGYGIHGTNSPKSIGKASSHGCIRMRNRDVEELFEMVRAGDEVELLSEPTVEVAKLLEAPPATPAMTADGGGA
jgi:lipoprotein-anchoring transpeptidase ErfK/SrfK